VGGVGPGGSAVHRVERARGAPSVQQQLPRQPLCAAATPPTRSLPMPSNPTPPILPRPPRPPKPR
jgi:hypothetical protein